MADEALKCFANLLDSIPGWIADLENILRTAAERQREILFENQPPTEQLHDSCHDRPREPSKGSSIRSNRSVGARPDLPTATDVDVTITREQVPHMTQSDALRLAQRKRKTASACSDDEQAPYKYRSRSMAVIYYDGDTQKKFEEMVRKIGCCRNSLRKAKMSARSDMTARSTSLSDDGADSDGSMEMPKIAFRSSRTRMQPAEGSNDGTEAFDKIDTFLDKAQSMCERAAHQVLRDGDCSLELKNATEHLGEAQKLGLKELPVWQTRAKEAAERARMRLPREPSKARSTGDATSGAASSSEEMLVVHQQSVSSPGLLEIDLEVDDSDGTDDDIMPCTLAQMNQEYSKRACLRSAGLTAR